MHVRRKLRRWLPVLRTIRGARALLFPFVSARRGTIAVMVALLLVPLVALAGIGMDFAAVTNVKANLGLALDAATLEAVNLASNASLRSPFASLVPAQTMAVNQFTAVAAKIGRIALHPVSVTIQRTGATYSATASYTATYTTMFGNLLGLNTMELSGTSTAVLATGPYVDIHILLDISNSMLIGGSLADINNLLALTATNNYGWGQCSFACHFDPNMDDFYGMSRTNGITLRLDQLKSAINTIATEMTSVSANNAYRLGLWTFNTDLTQVDALTTNAAQIAADAGNIIPTLFYKYPGVYSNTEITGSLTTFAQNDLQQAGNGDTASAPRKFVFLMTDGIEDVPGGSYRVESAVDTSACDAIKAKGASLVVLHTVYDNPNGIYDEISAIQPQVTAALQACASAPELYFMVGDQASITAAVQAMLNYAIASPTRLTQ